MPLTHLRNMREKLRGWWNGLGSGEKATYGSAIIASAIGGIVAIILAIIQIVAGSSPPPAKASSNDGSLPPIPPTTRPPTISLDPPSDTPTPEPTPAYGTALGFKIRDVGSTGGPGDVAFPENRKDQIDRFNSLLGPSGTPPPTIDMQTEMRYGGYALPGVYLALDIENRSSRALSITNIRVIKQRRQPIATGAIFYMPSGGGDAHSIFFELDQPNPIPRTVQPTTDVDKEGPHSETPFFRTNGLSIPGKGKSDYLDMIFAAQGGAYDFTIAFDYAFQDDDRKYVQVLANGDQPWRVTGSACQVNVAEKNPPFDSEIYRPGLRYGFVRATGYTDTYITKISDPSHGCFRG